MPTTRFRAHPVRRAIADLQTDRADVRRPELEARAVRRDQRGAMGELGHASFCCPINSTTAWRGTWTVSASNPPGRRLGSLLSSANAQCRLLVGGTLKARSSDEPF